MRSLFLSPDGDSGFGGYNGSEGGGMDRGGSGGGSGGEAPSYVPKADYEKLTGEFSRYRSENDRRYQDLEKKLTPRQEAQRQDSGPKNPYDNIHDYKFNDPQIGGKELARFNRDTYRYEQGIYEKEKAETERPQIEAQKRSESLSRAQNSFSTQAKDYEKENPGFLAKFATNGNPRTYDEVLPMILGGKNAPEVVDHFYTHPEALAELNSVAMQGGETAAAEFIGELRATLKQQKTVLKSRENAFRAQPTAGGFSGSSVTAKQKLTPKQLKELYR